MRNTKTVGVVAKGGMAVALLLSSAPCIAFRHPLPTRRTVSVTSFPGVGTTTPVEMTVNVEEKLPPPQYALWEGVDAALKSLRKCGSSLSFDDVMEELYAMHKNNDIYLQFDPYWKGKMKRPLTNKKREKAAFKEALRKRLEMLSSATSATAPIPDPAPRPSQYASKERFASAYVAYKNAHVDDRTRAQYRRKIGGMADFHCDMHREAARLWAEERRR